MFLDKDTLALAQLRTRAVWKGCHGSRYTIGWKRLLDLDRLADCSQK